MDEMQLQIVALVLAAMLGDQQATLLIQQIMQAAQQGDQQATQIAQMIQQVALQMQGVKAKNGAKLNYLKYLRGKCPEGFEMLMFKQGGVVCKKCVKKHLDGDTLDSNADTVTQFRNGRKTKKAALPMDKCGGKAKKKLIKK